VVQINLMVRILLGVDYFRVPLALLPDDKAFSNGILASQIGVRESDQPGPSFRATAHLGGLN